jgi:hypothetical protein
MEQTMRSQNQIDNDYIFEKNNQHDQTSFLLDEANNNNLLNQKRVKYLLFKYKNLNK